MSEDADWTIPVTLEDTLRQGRKRASMEQRRPVARRLSDLAGPGFGPVASRISDFNDPVATYNGYFSTAPLAENRPMPGSLLDAESTYIMHVIADAEYGGVQTVTRMRDGLSWRRIFRRNPGDPETITWTAWQGGVGTPM